MSDRSPFEGLYVIAKFYMSKAPDGTIHCISRSLGKLSIVEPAQESKVKHKEVWLCRIQKEIKPGLNRGAFILDAIKKVEDPEAQIKKIIPGFYDLQAVGKAAMVRPNSDPDAYWMLSKVTRQIFSSKYYAVVVPIQYQPDGTVFDIENEEETENALHKVPEQL
jgi:hypothetical protein